MPVEPDAAASRRRLARWAFVGLFALALLGLGFYLSEVTNPLLLGLLLAYILNPVVEALERRGWSRNASVIVLFGVVVVLFGGVVTFEVKGDLQTTSQFVDRMRIPYIAPSLGGVESLIEQPALMSYYEKTTEERLELGIKDNLVRFAVGIEDTDDLIADLEQALRVVETNPRKIRLEDAWELRFRE